MPIEQATQALFDKLMAQCGGQLTNWFTAIGMQEANIVVYVKKLPKLRGLIPETFQGHPVVVVRRIGLIRPASEQTPCDTSPSP